MKLNNKGYMLVEILISFGIAFIVVIFLTNLVIKFKNTNEDLYYETKYLKDKNIITRNIMDDLERAEYVADVYVGDFIGFHIFYEDGKSEDRRLEIATDEDGKTKIRYGKVDEGNNIRNYTFIPSHESYYEKTIESSLTVGKIIETKNNYFVASIPMYSIFSDKDYGIKISTKRKYRFDISINVCGDDVIDIENANCKNYVPYYSGIYENGKAIVAFDTKVDGEIRRKGTADTCEYFDKGTTFSITNMTIFGNPVDNIGEQGKVKLMENRSQANGGPVITYPEMKDSNEVSYTLTLENEALNYVSFIIYVDKNYKYLWTEIREQPSANLSRC